MQYNLRKARVRVYNGKSKMETDQFIRRSFFRRYLCLKE